MLAEYLGRQADCLIGSQGAIGIYLKCKFIKVSLLSDTGVGNSHIDTLYRCIDGIHCNHADW